MALVAAATAAAAAMGTALYINGKYGVKRDLLTIRRMKTIERMYAEAVKNNRVSLYYFFEKSVQLKPNDECIWSREGCYTWQQTRDRVHQFAQWFLQQGVKPGDLVSFYLMNSAEFIMAWVALWAIGAAPAMINYNLAGKALLHCLKVSGAKLLLVDGDLELLARIEDARGDIEGELRMKISVLDAASKREIRSMKAERPGDEFREGVKGDWPMTIFYTSGTTGMPKGVPFNMDRGFQAGALRGSNKP